MDPVYVAAHAQHDRDHWWFRGRLAVLLAVLERRLPRRRLRLVELGCGSGSVLAALARYGEAVGVEVDDALRGAAVARGLDVRRGALPDALPVEPGSADVVLLLDVLEHVEAEEPALAAARKVLAPGGLFVATVPAYRWLWSAHDVVLGHRRRYTRPEIRALVAGAGFRLERATYFSTLLLPPIAVVRLGRRLAGRDDHDLKRLPPALNAALAALFALERHLVSRVDLPFGSSVLLLARG
jgi:SAM-dependent methyltransferase